MKGIRIVLSTLFTVGLLGLLAFPLVSVGGSDIHCVQAGGARETVDHHSICWNLQNSGSDDVMVPVKTLSEWQDFISNPPAGIAFTVCTVDTYFSGC